MLMTIALLAAGPMALADSANEALASCQFAAARAAGARSEPAAQFAVTLERSCRNEEDTARRTAIAAMINRGLSRTEAAQRIIEASRLARAAVLAAYGP